MWFEGYLCTDVFTTCLRWFGNLQRRQNWWRERRYFSSWRRRRRETGVKATTHSTRRSQQRCHNNSAVSTTVVMPTDSYQPITGHSAFAVANARKTCMPLFWSVAVLHLEFSMEIFWVAELLLGQGGQEWPFGSASDHLSSYFNANCMFYS